MSRRRVAGLTLFVAGGLLLSFAGGKYALGAATQDEARRAWDDAKVAFDNAAASTQRDRFVSLVPGAPVARLVIPRIGLDQIVLEGVDEDVLNGGPGHMPGTALPGEQGNSVISGHRDRHFRHFDQLSVGDTILTESGSRRAQWVLVSKRVVDKDAPAIFRTTKQQLTLTTCWPIAYLGSAPDRLILTAKLLSDRKG